MMASAPVKPTSVLEQTFREQLSQASLADLQIQADWLAERKEAARQHFESSGLPNRREEAWRFVDFSVLGNQPFQLLSKQPVPDLSQEIVQPYFNVESSTSRLVFINGQFSPAYSNLINLPEGVIVSELLQGLHQYGERFAQYLGARTPADSDPFAQLNTALFESGALIYIPDHLVLEQPIQLLFLTKVVSGLPGAAVPRNLLVLGSHTKVTVTMEYVGLDGSETAYLNNSMTELYLAEGAQLSLIDVQAEGESGFQMSNTRAYLADQSTADIFSISLGGQLSRHNIEVQLQGEQALSRIYGLAILNGAIQIHDRTMVDHQAPHARSEQLYKGIIDDSARSEFDGTIQIQKNASQSDATQLNRNLLLSNEARVFTRPQLRIDTDDVKCAHGATVGQLEEEHLFYLASRGLSAEVARSILTYGFAEEIIEKIAVPSLQERLNQQIRRRLQSPRLLTPTGK